MSSNKNILTINGIDAFYISKPQISNLVVEFDLMDPISPNGAQYLYNILFDRWETYKRFDDETFEIKVINGTVCHKLYTFYGLIISSCLMHDEGTTIQINPGDLSLFNILNIVKARGFNNVNVKKISFIFDYYMVSK